MSVIANERNEKENENPNATHYHKQKSCQQHHEHILSDYSTRERL